jgi:hypothetical protein
MKRLLVNMLATHYHPEYLLIMFSSLAFIYLMTFATLWLLHSGFYIPLMVVIDFLTTTLRDVNHGCLVITMHLKVGFLQDTRVCIHHIRL